LSAFAADFDGEKRVQRTLLSSNGTRLYLCVGIGRPRKTESFSNVARGFWRDRINFSSCMSRPVNRSSAGRSLDRMKHCKRREPRLPGFIGGGRQPRSPGLYANVARGGSPDYRLGCGGPC